MSKIKILVIPSDTHGVGKFRMLDPYKYIGDNYNNEIHVDIVFNAENTNEYFQGYDAVIFNSHIHQTDHQDNINRIKWLKKEGIKVIMDIDDYWLTDKTHPMHNQIILSKIPEKKIELLRLSDYVTTTTTVFANTIEYKIKNKNVLIFPNSINDEEKQFKSNKQKTDKIRFGWSGGSCLTPDTEILTDEGWKFFDKLNGNEKVATLNPENDHLEYHKPDHYIEQEYDDNIYSCNTTDISFSVTGNHNMFASKTRPFERKKLNFKLLTAEKLAERNFYVKKNMINTNSDVEHFIIPSYQNDFPEKKVPMDEWLTIFGFFTSNGTVNQETNDVSILQYEEKNYLTVVYDLLVKNGFEVTYHETIDDDNVITISDKQLYSYLSQFGDETKKYIPRQLLNELSERQLRLLLDWYLNGVGDVNRYYKYVLKRNDIESNQLADDLMEITLKMGSQLNILNTKLITLIKKSQITKEHYVGKVYCVSVKNNIIHVRRNGKSLWVGNSHKSDIELLSEGISSTYTSYKDKVQFVLCGFDTRGDVTEINKATGQQRKRPILPQETVWFNYEQIFTKNYTTLDEKYKEYLMKFTRENYDDLEKTYRRRWTEDINNYGYNYNLFDITLVPLVDSVFNNNKSQLKIIESGFHKNAVICSEINPYVLDIINANDEGKFNSHGNGLFVNPKKNHKDWGRNMKRLIESPNMIEDLGNRLYETVKDKYSLKNTCEKRVQFLKTIINK